MITSQFNSSLNINITGEQTRDPSQIRTDSEQTENPEVDAIKYFIELISKPFVEWSDKEAQLRKLHDEFKNNKKEILRVKTATGENIFHLLANNCKFIETYCFHISFKLFHGKHNSSYTIHFFLPKYSVSIDDINKTKNILSTVTKFQYYFSI